MLDLSVVVPCLNESENIPSLLKRIDAVTSRLGLRAEVNIVDDGSSDGTGEEAVRVAAGLSIDVNVIRHDSNRGIFESWKSGTSAANGDFVLFMDADLQNRPESIPDLWHRMQERESHLVQGVRIPANSLDKSRARDSRALNWILNALYRDSASDSKSGFFIAPVAVVRDILNIRKQYAYPHTFIRMSALSRGYTVEEVLTPFEPRTAGDSIFNGAKLLRVYSRVIVDLFRGLSEFRRREHPARRALLEFAEPYPEHDPYRGARKFRMNLYYATMPLHAWLLRRSSRDLFIALRKTQFAASQQVEEFQFRQLQRLVWHAYVNVPYYRYALQAAGVVPDDIRELTDIEKLPLLSKDDVADNVHYGMFAKNPAWKKLHRIVTSGSTGRPSTSYGEQTQLEIRHGSTLRAAEWTGWRIGDKQMRLWHQTLGMSWSQSVREHMDAWLLRRKFIPAFELTPEALNNLIRDIEEYRPVLLDGYAESLNFLATYTNTGREIAHQPHAIMSSAQMLTTQTRDQIETTMGCKVYDKYGAREFSGIAYECAYGSKHAVSDSYILEVLSNNAVTPVGETGEVVITDLNNFAVPMIRYRIGDLALQVENAPCACGRAFRQLGPIQGRTQALVHCANGRWIPGTFFAHFFKEYESDVQFFQVIQEVSGAFDLLVVKNEAWSEAGWNRMLVDLRDYVGETEIRVSFVEEIPLLKTGKRTPVISKVKFDFQRG